MRPFCLLALILLLQEVNCSQKQQKLYDFKTKLHHHSSQSQSLQISSSSDFVKSSGRVFYPIGYGADPSGAQDSTAAIMGAVIDASLVENGQQLLPGVNDLGGAIVDLQGGSFRISKPIAIPPNSGNLVVKMTKAKDVAAGAKSYPLIEKLTSC